MKKNILWLVILVLVLSVILSSVVFAGGKSLKIVHYINGNLGDKSFFDSANRGFEMVIKEFGVSGRTIEGGHDPEPWESDVQQLSEGDWDIIIVGTWQLVEIIEKIAPTHPEKKYILYDAEVDYSKGNLGNVYSMLYKQNEGSFLAGVLAALCTTSDLPLANPEKVIGFLGAMDIPVINDFKVGYIQGAKYINPEVNVLVSYIGSFSDPAKGKELTLAQYDQGVDIAFNVAAESGLGLLDAAKEKKRYAIGGDSDQFLLFKDSDPEKASYIVTSMVKNVDKSIYRAIDLYLKGELKFGEAEGLGIKEGGVELADNENFKKLIPEDFREKIKKIEEKILAGEIVVDTAF